MQQICEADTDTSIQQRPLMEAGTAVKGTAETLTAEGGENEGMKIAGGM